MAKQPESTHPESAPGGSGSDPATQAEPVNLALAEVPASAPVSSAAESASPAPAESAPPGDAKAELATLSANGNTNRLSPADEDRATRLMRDCLLEGETGIPAALDAMPKLPWILGVRAIENAWSTISAESRAAILAGLSQMESDNGYRLRLSVARSLAKMEATEAVRIAAAACRSMWNADGGSLKPEHSKLVGNVFIGRGKPWVLQLSLTDLEEADLNGILSAVVFSAFNVNNPPITQLSVLRYAGERIGQLHENLIGMVARAVGRWSGKWQKSLRTEVANLPEPIASVLKPEQPAEAKSAPEESAGSEDSPAAVADDSEPPLPPELEEKLRIATESGDPAFVEVVNQEINAWREAERMARLEALDAEEDDEDEDEEEEDDDEAEEGGEATEGRGRRNRGRRGRKERPAYVSREQEAKGLGAFNFASAIKQLEAYVSGLRNDLSAAQSKLKRTESRRESTDRPLLSHEEANLSPDELKRLVIQLEARNTELQARVEELTTDSEVRGLAMAAGTTDPSPDPVTQLRTVLALKLNDDYNDFLTLQKQSPDAIVQQHYPGLIRHVFDVLLGEHIPLQATEEPAPARTEVVPPQTAPVVEAQEEVSKDAE